MMLPRSAIPWRVFNRNGANRLGPQPRRVDTGLRHLSSDLFRIARTGLFIVWAPPGCVATSWRELRYLFQGGNGSLSRGRTMARGRKDSKFEVYGQEMIEKVVH
ncbi:MAG: hypothetical protein AABY08_05855, partial [Candidatus Thermoplasmatota archaeon]